MPRDECGNRPLASFLRRGSIAFYGSTSTRASECRSSFAFWGFTFLGHEVLSSPWSRFGDRLIPQPGIQDCIRLHLKFGGERGIQTPDCVRAQCRGFADHPIITLASLRRKVQVGNTPQKRNPCLHCNSLSVTLLIQPKTVCRRR